MVFIQIDFQMRTIKPIIGQQYAKLVPVIYIASFIYIYIYIGLYIFKCVCVCVSIKRWSVDEIDVSWNG